MHAYLLVGTDTKKIKERTEVLSQNLGATILEYPIVKIEDVRNLNNFLRLAVLEPTAILIENIENAGTEALNAFLKNLEEPQDNLYFILTASSISKVLPTIVSRCQIIKITNNQTTKSTNEASEKFLKMTAGEKFKEIEKIKDRGLALDFVNNLTDTLHVALHESGADLNKISKNLKITTETQNNLKANGNVSLQLTNLVIRLI